MCFRVVCWLLLLKTPLVVDYRYATTKNLAIKFLRQKTNFETLLARLKGVWIPKLPYFSAKTDKIFKSSDTVSSFNDTKEQSILREKVVEIKVLKNQPKYQGCTCYRLPTVFAGYPAGQKSGKYKRWKNISGVAG